MSVPMHHAEQPTASFIKMLNIIEKFLLACLE
jgi:hypothetical protein